MDSTEDCKSRIAECVASECRELRRLQSLRARRVSGRWWPGQLLFLNWRIRRAAKRVNLMVIWLKG